MRSLILLAALALAACGDSTSSPKDAAAHQDAGPVDGSGGPDASCFTNPHSHYEIINACTGAQKVYKDSHPPLLNPDGSLPMLPQ
jgi:hypothetical protein